MAREAMFSSSTRTLASFTHCVISHGAAQGEHCMRVAVVGMGKMGIVHSCVLNAIPGVDVIGLCEKSRMIRRFLGKIFTNAEIVDDVEKLSDQNLDIVYVTTPIPSHYSIVKTVYSSRVARNIFVEKTLANSYEEAQELCVLASRNNGTNMVGYLRRFYVTFRKTQEILAQKILGDLSSFDIHAFSSDFLGLEQKESASIARGGVLRDLGCYALDLALWYFGELEIKPMHADSTNSYNNEHVLKFRSSSASGLSGSFRISWCVKGYRTPEVGVTIVGSKGKLEANDDLVRLSPKRGRELVWHRHDLNDSVPFWLGLPEYYREDSYFVERVRSGTKAEPDFGSASKVDQMIAEVEKLGD